MARGRKTGGRRPGGKNKQTLAVRDALIEAFDNLGGVLALARWAKREPGEFYRLWAKLLPREIKADVSVAGRMVLVEEIVDGNPPTNDSAPPGTGPIPPQ